jgi:hypothetical protein
LSDTRTALLAFVVIASVFGGCALQRRQIIRGVDPFATLLANWPMVEGWDDSGDPYRRMTRDCLRMVGFARNPHFGEGAGIRFSDVMGWTLLWKIGQEGGGCMAGPAVSALTVASLEDWSCYAMKRLPDVMHNDRWEIPVGVESSWGAWGEFRLQSDLCVVVTPRRVVGVVVKGHGAGGVVMMLDRDGAALADASREVLERNVSVDMELYKGLDPTCLKVLKEVGDAHGVELGVVLAYLGAASGVARKRALLDGVDIGQGMILRRRGGLWRVSDGVSESPVPVGDWLVCGGGIALPSSLWRSGRFIIGEFGRFCITIDDKGMATQWVE